MLYVVMLGGKHPKANIEVHDVVFVEGDSLESCYPQLRELWFGSLPGMHIDSWLQVDGVEGYQVRFSDTPPEDGALKLFLLNFGGYLPGNFGEEHQFVLQLAHDKAEAKALGKQRYPQLWDKPHTDAVIDIDDCLAIEQVGAKYLHLVPGAHAELVQQSDYLVLG
ncbi:DUF1543 domain-containing protein [Rheinheimera sp.]|uniref:DUF1543 domain-containing protein n=1 Tax=Rheinheimera sp. TaxID=1869214 RepID=UPI00307E38FC